MTICIVNNNFTGGDRKQRVICCNIMTAKFSWITVKMGYC